MKAHTQTLMLIKWLTTLKNSSKEIKFFSFEVEPFPDPTQN